VRAQQRDRETYLEVVESRNQVVLGQCNQSVGLRACSRILDGPRELGAARQQAEWRSSDRPRVILVPLMEEQSSQSQQAERIGKREMDHRSPTYVGREAIPNSIRRYHGPAGLHNRSQQWPSDIVTINSDWKAIATAVSNA